MTKANHFIHFGCWNNLNTKEKDGKTSKLGCLEDVMSKLTSRIEEYKTVDFLAIAGDNYYPKKSKNPETGEKEHIVYVEKLRRGFELLPEDIKTYMILGNHDLETNKESRQKIFIEEKTIPEEPGNCFILQKQIRKIHKKKNIEFTLLKKIILDNDTLLLMIDTSMYSEDANDFLPCYNHLFSDSKFNSIKDLQNYQNTLIMEYLENTNIKNLIIIGHHPITGYKIKDKTIKQLNDIPRFFNVLKEIFTKLGPSINYYYLCADLHLYQKGTVTLENFNKENENMIIKQYIAGTGGTELDEIVDNPNNEEKERLKIRDDLNYDIEETQQACGFLDCQITKDGLEFEFIALTQRAGQKMKTIRKRNIKQTEKSTKKQTDKKTNRQKSKQTKKQTDKKANRQKSKQTKKQTDKKNKPTKKNKK